MGRGSYTASDWLKLSNSRGLNSVTGANRIYTSKAAADTYNAKKIGTRLSCDSQDSPEATPVILGFDVTSSMGFLAEEIGKRALNQTILSLLEKKPITNPHILCAAIGDCKSDRYPLQATQFEADIRIVKQLLDLYLEGGGGGNGGESYNLLWYFAARHTKTDAWEKRQQKGFLFTIGDDCCHSSLSRAEIASVFPETPDYALSNEELLREAGTRYEVFHIHMEMPKSGPEPIRSWQQLLPGRVAVLPGRDVSLLPELILCLIQMTGGMTANAALKALDQEKAEKLAPALANIRISTSKSKKIISF